MENDELFEEAYEIYLLIKEYNASELRYFRAYRSDGPCNSTLELKEERDNLKLGIIETIRKLKE